MWGGGRGAALLLLAALLGGASSSLAAEEAPLRAALARSPADAPLLAELGGLLSQSSDRMPEALKALRAAAKLDVNGASAEVRGARSKVYQITRIQIKCAV